MNAINLGQYLTFILDSEIYSIEISQVREVLDMTSITKVPRMPPYMRGVINLRGSVVPVIDLREKFQISAIDDTVDTCIIILEIEEAGIETVIGVIADSVQEVVTLEDNVIEAAPKIGMQLETEFIKGMSKKDEKFIIILDVESVFSVYELQGLPHLET